MDKRHGATKDFQIAKERQMKLFLSSRPESTEEAVNNWLVTNTGEFELYDIL